MASTFSNDAMLTWLRPRESHFCKNGSARMVPWAESTMLALRSYAVDNRYVMRKMQKVLIPFYRNTGDEVIFFYDSIPAFVLSITILIL
jgi:hypothetical protein